MSAVLPATGRRPLPLVENKEGGVDLYDPATGEALILADATVDQLAAAHEAIREYQRLAGIMRRQIAVDLERRRRALGGAAKAVDGMNLRVQRTVRREWDEARTVEALQALVEDGAIPPEEAVALVPMVEVRKPDGRALTSLVNRLIGDERLEDAQLLLAARDESASWKVEALVPVAAPAATTEGGSTV